jgi:hypothetical protein
MSNLAETAQTTKYSVLNNSNNNDENNNSNNNNNISVLLENFIMNNTNDSIIKDVTNQKRKKNIKSIRKVHV